MHVLWTTCLGVSQLLQVSLPIAKRSVRHRTQRRWAARWRVFLSCGAAALARFMLAKRPPLAWSHIQTVGGCVFGCGGHVFVLQRAPGRCGSGTNMRTLCASCLFNGFTMRATANQPATTLKKRAVNLTLNVDLVEQAKTFNGNLSATMETLLADYVAQRQQARLSRQQMADACVEYWNEVLAAESLFADEHSTLYSKRWLSSTYTATKARCTHRCPSLSSSNPHYLTATDDVWWCRFGNAQQHCQNSLQWPALE